MTSTVAVATRSVYRSLERERRWLAEGTEEVLRAQLAITRIPAPTGGEESRARWIANAFHRRGFASRIDPAGNVVARTPAAAGAPRIVVCAHLDTVFPADTDLRVSRDGPRWCGPGICDNGRGLAAMLAIACAMRHHRTPALDAIEFVATTGEEGAGDLRGAKFYFQKSGASRAVVALDGAGDSRIVNTALGSRRFRVEYAGPGGHSWSAFGTANPVHAAARAAAALANVPIPHQSALTVSRIGGGGSVNSVPEGAWFEVDVRGVSEEWLTATERTVHEIARASGAEENRRRDSATAPMTWRVTRTGFRPGGETPAASDLVVAAVESTRLIGGEPELAIASTDANAAIGVGIPAIAIGGGGFGGAAHSRHEWFDNTRASSGVERALTIIATMAHLAMSRS